MKAKSAYFNDRIIECKNDLKALYRVLNGLLHREKKQCLPTHECPTNLADMFSDFFTSKIEKIRDHLSSQCLSSDQLLDHQPEHPVAGSLHQFTQVTTEDVAKLMKSSPKKSCPLDPIPALVLYECLDEVVPFITRIINLSITSGTFPSALKQALIFPLLKKSSLDSENLTNYRPVSNLAFISKTIERVIAKQFQNHMSEYNMYQPMQSAYRAKHSTETAILRVHNDILMAMDQGKTAILLMLDLSAAFDTIDHDLLIHRLETLIGVKGKALEWFKSYLSARTQSVCISSHSSSAVGLTTGVPQGSVLGPVLFTVYTIPVGDIVRQHGLEIHVYADDTQIYTFCVTKSPSAMSSSIRKVEQCVNDLATWMSRNKLKLNHDKSELLVLRSHLTSQPIIPSLCIAGSVISPAKEVRNLGCVFDQRLSMSAQINQLTRSCFHHLRRIGSIRRLLTPEAAAALIHSLVTSKLDLGNAVLFGLPDTSLQQLQRVQNTAARIVSLTRKYEHISPVLKRLHWLPVKKRVEFKIILLTYKALHGMTPEYIRDLLSAYVPSRELRSSNHHLLTIPKTRLKSYGNRAFSAAAPLLWNSLPQSMRSPDITSLSVFKKRLKHHLYSQSF